MEGSNRNAPQFPHRSDSRPLPVVYLNNPNPIADSPRCTVEPHDTGDVHFLIQRDTSGRVNKLERGVDIVRLPCHLLVLGIGSGPYMGRVSRVLSYERGREAGSGFVTTLRTFSVLVIWLLEVESGWIENCIESISATSGQYMRHETPSQDEKQTDLRQKDSRLGTS